MLPKEEKAFSEMSKAEQLKRARAARRKADATLTGPTRSNKREERAGAFKAKKAAERVETRITGKPPERLDATKPGGGGMDLGAGARGLMEIAKKAASLPAAGRENLEKVRKASER